MGLKYSMSAELPYGYIEPLMHCWRMNMVGLFYDYDYTGKDRPENDAFYCYEFEVCLSYIGFPWFVS